MRLLNNLSLGRKLLVLTTIGLLLGVGLFSFLGMRAVNQATETMLQDRLTTASLMADYVDDALEHALSELEDTAQMIIIGDGNSQFEEQIQALESTYSHLAIYVYGIYLVNENGQVIWSDPPDAAIQNTDLYFYPTISKIIDNGKANISGLISAPATNTPVVLLSSPTKKEQNGGKGALVAAIDISKSSIGGFVQPIKLGQTGYVEIVDQNGIVVTRTEPGPLLAPFEKSDHSGRFADLIAAGEPTRGLCHTCHEPVIKVERRDVLAFVPLSQAQWGVVIRQSEEEALAPINGLRQNLIIAGTGFILITVLFVFTTTRDVVNRVRALITASQRIAEGDLTSPVTTTVKDEVGILAHTFDDMRTKLKTSYDDLERRTKELSSLLSVSEILFSLSDLSNLDNALKTALDKTLEIMNRNIGGILLWDDERQGLYYHVHHGLSQKYTKEVRCRLGEGIVGRVAQAGEPIITEDISRDSRATYADLISAEGLHSFASVPILSKEKVLGVLNIASYEVRGFSPADVRLLEGIARQIATAIENARLHQEVQNKEKVRGELLGEIFSIQEEERKRIARELHDETSQVLASLNACLEATTSTLPIDADKAKVTLKKAQDLSINILDGVHKLIYELRPSLLDDLGLVAATKWLVENIPESSGTAVNFKIKGRPKRLAPKLETTMFRVIQEAINNVGKHAEAKNITVNLHFNKSAISVHIKDDGIGFDIKEAINSKNRPRGLGLLGMKERIELARGTLEIRSRRGHGTEIDIEIPMNKEASYG